MKGFLIIIDDPGHDNFNISFDKDNKKSSILYWFVP